MVAEAAKLLRTAPKVRRRSAGFRIKFKTQTAGDSTPVTINFDFRRPKSLLNRIIVLIGYNDTGKTKIMSNLTTVSSGYGYESKEELLNKSTGRFIGSEPPFETVVVVSYSAFDAFVIPGRNRTEKARIHANRTIFGYVYCGLRELIDNSNDHQAYRHKARRKIELEFLSALNRIRRADRFNALLGIREPLLSHASFRPIGLSQLQTENGPASSSSLFRGLSGGHKVALKIITDLTAHMAEKNEHRWNTPCLSYWILNS